MTNAVDLYLSDLEKIGIDFQKRIELLFRSGSYKTTDLQQVIAEMDFFTELVDLGYMEDLKKFLRAYDNEITVLVNEAKKIGVRNIGSGTIADLETLRDIDGEALLRRAEMFSSQYKSALLKSIISSTSLDQIRSELLPQIQTEVPFQPSWFNSMVATSYSQFNASALAKLYEHSPERKFELDHPFDERTRKQCIHAIELMKEYPAGLTKKEIDNGILGEYESGGELTKYNFINRGGYNCRGRWKVKTRFEK